MQVLTIQLDSPVAITEQIVEGIRQRIAAGDLEPDAELPPVRQLAADLGVNLNTVARAYRVLESHGLVTAVRGRGTWVASALERRSEPIPGRDRRIRDRFCRVVADAKLAGLSPEATQRVFQQVLRAFYPRQLGRKAEHALV